VAGDAIGIQECNNIASRCSNPNISAGIGTEVAPISNDPKQCGACMRQQRVQRIGCSVPGEIVDHHNFYGWQRLPKQALHATNNLDASVARGHDNGHSRLYRRLGM
jgi:hypothetical protein